MIRYSVSSSRMRAVGWENNVLEIEFNDHSVYQYYDVTEQEYLNFINSSSLGRALSQLDKVHRYSRIC